MSESSGMENGGGNGRRIVRFDADEMVSKLPHSDHESIDMLGAVWEHGELPHMDAATQARFNEVLSDSNRMQLFGRAMRGVPHVAKHVGWKMGAIGTGVATGLTVGTLLGGKLAAEYATGKAKGYFHGAFVGPVRESAQAVPPAYTAPDDMSVWGVLRLGKAIGQAIWHKGAQTAEPVVSMTADTVAEVIGKMASLPGAVGGYIALSFVAAGAVAALHEYFKNSSFEKVEQFIVESEAAIAKKPAEGEPDGRRRLVTLFDELLDKPGIEGPNKLSIEQWLFIAAATLRADLSLLRGQVEPSAINIFSEGEQTQEAQRVAVEKLIEHFIEGEQKITQLDATALAHILKAFRKNVSETKSGEGVTLAHERRLSQRLPQYASAFVRTGFMATGLPLVGMALNVGLHPIQSLRKVASGGVRLAGRAGIGAVRKGKEYLRNRKDGDPKDPLTPRL